MRRLGIHLIPAWLSCIAPAVAGSNADFDTAMTGTEWLRLPVGGSWWSLYGSKLYLSKRDPGTSIFGTYQLDRVSGAVTQLSNDDAATVEPDGPPIK